MKTWIALVRGINVLGKNLLPMNSLTLLLQREGFSDIRTYIQSGNAVFRCETGTSGSLSDRISRAVHRVHGFLPRVMVLTVKDLEKAVALNPFRSAVAKPQTLHLFFLNEEPQLPDLASLNRLKAAKEDFALKGRIFYLHTPDGFGRSKLAAKAERLIQVDATARNWRTVTKLLEMAKQAQ